MSRVEECNKLIDKMKNTRLQSVDNAAILSALMDIAASLAIIADCELDNHRRFHKPIYKSITEVDDGK